MESKIDIRVTLVYNRVFAVSILKNGLPIEGDWRRTPSEEITYAPLLLPIEIEHKIFKLMSELGLVFGGIDIALVAGQYYFIEINPTGEWGWLSSIMDIAIDKAIVDYLQGGKGVEQNY